MPREQRREVLKEQVRLTKKGGHIIVCDSLQISDRPEWREILEDFPKRYHEPFYNNYIKDDLISAANEIGLELVHQNKVLLTKCLIFKK
jgi:ubiquinone/menaquinone biosynthesis C-methylase UbiE